ncbi:unnamed protein product [Lactuca virosa]|uniref:Uncharacterized protein n=1 Tax=Lactuca virosa TaxID=75947 RepID=A0AAU9NII1_9ASTR|nr:unnamed protein product [Lactuca virosa]
MKIGKLFQIKKIRKAEDFAKPKFQKEFHFFQTTSIDAFSPSLLNFNLTFDWWTGFWKATARVLNLRSISARWDKSD